eukprot:COSAG01_NODE_39331_length_477_cov_214.685185_1_plen_149_part_10
MRVTESASRQIALLLRVTNTALFHNVPRLDSTVLRWPSSLLMKGKEAARARDPGSSSSCCARSGRPPTQVMTLLLLQLVLGQLYGAEKSPQQLAHTPAHQLPPVRRPGPVFFNCSNISKGLRRCLSVPPAHHTHHTASLMPCAHCKPVR